LEKERSIKMRVDKTKGTLRPQLELVFLEHFLFTLWPFPVAWAASGVVGFKIVRFHT